MDQELKEKILNSVRREHGIALDNKDPIFAIITANDIILQEQIKQLHNIFELQLIDMEQVTTNYLENGKELLEKRLTIALQEAKQTLQESQETNTIKEEKPTLAIPIISLIVGCILGYGFSLFIL